MIFIFWRDNIFFFCFLVCRNQYNQACNIFGVDRICAQNSCGDECRFGYMNENCGFCLRGYFNVSGPNGYVNDQTGEGVRCTGNLWNCKLWKMCYSNWTCFSLPWWVWQYMQCLWIRAKLQSEFMWMLERIQEFDLWPLHWGLLSNCWQQFNRWSIWSGSRMQR